MVRLATGDDVASIASLEAAVLPDPWSEASIEKYLVAPRQAGEPHAEREPRSVGREAWVAEIDGQTCGYLLASWTFGEGNIDRVGVEPAWRRRGIARALMEDALAGLARRGVREVWLEVGASNEPAVRLYEAAGFSIVTRRRRYYPGPPPDDALIMKRMP